jgi:hypothetical protein
LQPSRGRRKSWFKAFAKEDALDVIGAAPLIY